MANKLIVVSSGSIGNCYILDCDGERLIIEQGVPYGEFLKASGFDVSGVVGLIASHTHGDHFKYAKDFQRYGYESYYPFENTLRSTTFGGYKVQAFEVPHDPNIHCFGFYIRHEGLGKLLFLTDLAYCPFDFSKLKVDHIMVECNYCDSLLEEDIENLEHKVSGHMSLATCKEFVKQNASKNLKTVTLLHLGQFSDEELMVANIESVVDSDVMVTIAERRKVISLDSIF